MRDLLEAHERAMMLDLTGREGRVPAMGAGRPVEACADALATIPAADPGSAAQTRSEPRETAIGSATQDRAGRGEAEVVRRRAAMDELMRVDGENLA